MRKKTQIAVAAMTLVAATAAQARRSIVADTHAMLSSVEGAVIHYQTDHDDACPRSIEELVAQKYLARSPRDAWGRRLYFACPGTQRVADVASLGFDGILGTDDDISNWDDRSPAVLVMPRVGMHERIGAVLAAARWEIERWFR